MGVDIRFSMRLVASLLVLAGLAQAGTPAGRHGLEIDLQSLEADVEAMVAQAKESHGLEEDMFFSMVKHGIHAVFSTNEERHYKAYCTELEEAMERSRTSMFDPGMTNFGPFWLCGVHDASGRPYTNANCAERGVGYTGTVGTNSQWFTSVDVRQMYEKLQCETGDLLEQASSASSS